MRIRTLAEIVLDPSGLVCRQSRWAGISAVLVFGGAMVGATVAVWWTGGPAYIWIPIGLFALLLVPMFVADARVRFRATNWCLWVRRDGLLVNVRSYQDQSPLDAPAVIELGYSEVAEARRYTDRYTTPDSDGGSVRRKLESLEVQLRQADNGELATMLAENRRREQPERAILGFMRMRSRPTNFAVTLPRPDVIRIAWRGGAGNWMTPSLRRVLPALAEHVHVGEPLRSDRDDWRKLTDAQVDDQVLEFIQAGNRLEAIRMLVRLRGYSQTEAHQFVEELSKRV